MIQSIAQIPFALRDPLELLHLERDRDAIDPDYTGFGHARIDALTLVTRDGEQRVRDARVIALHCADPGEARGSDIELEFFLDEIAPGLSVSAPLSRFLSVWLPTVLHGDERAVVLALCNPHRADVPKPAALEGAGVPMYYALGEVESWYDGGVTLRAEAWRVAR